MGGFFHRSIRYSLSEVRRKFFGRSSGFCKCDRKIIGKEIKGGRLVTKIQVNHLYLRLVVLIGYYWEVLQPLSVHPI
jgi:hypothetical protein